jgi:hypothetical protein
MKRFLATAVVVLFGLGFYGTAHAAVIMISEIDRTSFSELRGGVIVDLNTSVTEINNTMAIKRNRSLYYSTNLGIAKQTIGQPTTTLLKEATDIKLVNGRAAQLLISNNAATGNTGSYIYNVDTKKTSRLSMIITDIVQGSFSPNGKWLAIIGKNEAGELHLFVSGNRVSRMKQYDLPTGAQLCTSLAIAPDSATLAIACNSDPGTSLGINLYRYKNYALGRGRQYLENDFTPYAIVWRTKNNLAGLGYTMSAVATSVDKLKVSAKTAVELRFAAGLHTYAVNNGKINSRRVYPFVTSGIVGAGQYVIPMQIALSSPNVILYNALYFPQVPTDKSSIYSYLGRYNLKTRTHAAILNNEKINFFTEYPTVASLAS